MSSNFWDIRYSEQEYAYGIQPNKYFKHFIDHHVPGKILLPGEGEGRNAVYAARNGWEVTAIDQSSEGRRKAMELAESNDVSFTYHVGDLTHVPFQNERFDAIALIFVHFPPEVRMHFHKMFMELLVTGGFLLMEAFSKDQLGRTSGGPQAIELLYDRILLSQDFQKLNILELYEMDEILDEGPFHQGQASVVRLLARKE